MKARAVQFLSLAIGALFIYAGVLKALDPARFAVDVHNYRLLPWIVSAAAALYLPWLEIAAGAALAWRQSRAAAAWLLTSLMLIFLAAIVAAKLRGIDVACGCFGSSGAPGEFWKIIARDVAILAGLGFVLRATKDAPLRNE